MDSNNINRRKAIKLTAYIMGTAVSASAIAAVMSGCQSETGKSNQEGSFTDWTPQALTKNQALLVEAATERIIPATDTAGAKDAKVNQFIDLYLKDIASTEERNSFLKGLATLDTDAQAAHNKTFVQLNSEQQDAVMTALMNRDADQPFFFGLKELTLLGFFTSEIGATQVLKYDKIPGGYKGCIPFEEVGVTWAT